MSRPITKGFPPHVPMTFHVGLVTDNTGKPDPRMAYMTYGSAHGENDQDCEIQIVGGAAHAVARMVEALPDMLALLRELIDIEGPQPGTADWAEKVRVAIAKATGAS
jgi:hypothetical protein